MPYPGIAHIDQPHVTAVTAEMHCHLGESYSRREIEAALAMGYVPARGFLPAGNYQYMTDEALEMIIAEAEARGRAEALQGMDCTAPD